MGLNKSKGNMYEFITHTWNPLAGACPHGCTYCSTNKLMRYPGIKNKYTGDVRLQESELKTNLGSGNFIFVAAQNDLFANQVPEEIIKRVLGYCGEFDNKYLFQTKNPANIRRILPYESHVCVTIETNRHYPEIMRNSPSPHYRGYQSMWIRHPLYITIEPIMDFDLPDFVNMLRNIEPIQINIGADSGNNGLPEPPKDKLLALIEELQKFTIIHNKTNLKRLLR
jgi:DNA repair photolyase